ncbi:MAG TPA: hypothetical protein VMF51_06180 [Nocardioides sp.]|uniref:hypothetical protein n=1 Tax=Nocardioides sp. TaxID=35761 RepID=UPI002BD490E5|nr:hypothetical protein [Nocardioides sp.]HTW14696.1 hypothetical protein [Nocardioides sp.]
MTTLRDRLADLAEEAPYPPDAPDLWDRGRRYGRRRRAGVAAVALAVVVAVASGVLSLVPWQEVPVHPASGESGLRLPDRVYRPSPWTPGTDDTGPVGPLVAVVETERASWTGYGSGLAAVSTEGEYVFLDLDDRTGDAVGLSADGRWLAYWYTDPDRPELSDGSDEPAAAGVAVLDTVTGETERRPLGGRHGVMPSGVAWAGSVLWAPEWQINDPEQDDSDGVIEGHSTMERVVAWDLLTGAQTDHDPTSVLTELPSATSAGDRLLILRNGGIHLVGPDGRRERIARVSGQRAGTAALDPTGSRLADLGDTDPMGDGSDDVGPIRVGRLPADPGGRVVLTTIDGPMVNELVGWRNGREVVARRLVSGSTVYEAVDVETGARSTLLAVDPELGSSVPQLATDALAAPVLDAPEPPSRQDPRLVLGAGLGVAVALGALGLLLWRRRVRA